MDVIPEATIEPFKIGDEEGPRYLLPSPEIYLKPLLSIGLERFFHIGPAFRKGEKGPIHSAEFTILEWYRGHENYTRLMEDCMGLLSSIFRAFRRSALVPDLPVLQEDASSCSEVITVEEAFTRYAGWNPLEIRNEQRFEQDIVEKIEPALSLKCIVFLIDFPCWAASLSRLKKSDERVSERFELYISGIEMANGFSELVNSAKQRARFHAENRQRISAGLDPEPLPEQFLNTLDRCPPSAGIAMGIDRLLMFLVGADSLTEIIPPFSLHEDLTSS